MTLPITKHYLAYNKVMNDKFAVQNRIRELLKEWEALARETKNWKFPTFEEKLAASKSAIAPYQLKVQQLKERVKLLEERQDREYARAWDLREVLEDGTLKGCHCPACIKFG